MGRKQPTLRTRLNLIGTVILLAGLAGALVVYLTARDDSADAVGYEIASGNVYAVSPRDSKAYRHDLELYGGKAAVMADELNQWFEGLWHGRRLAYTLAVLATGCALGCFLAARHPRADSSRGNGEDREV